MSADSPYQGCSTTISGALHHLVVTRVSYEQPSRRVSEVPQSINRSWLDNSAHKVQTHSATDLVIFVLNDHVVRLEISMHDISGMGVL